MGSKFLKEFKEFAIKGSMIDIAIGIIIGAAFNNVVDTLVKKVLMPPISLLTNGINFQNKKFILRPEFYEGEKLIHEEVAIEYGTLITVLINFLIIGLCTFFVVKIMNTLRNRAEDPKEKVIKPPKDIELLGDLKDIMEEQNKLLKELSNKNRFIFLQFS